MWTLDKARVEILVLFCCHVRVEGFYRGIHISLYLIKDQIKNHKRSELSN